MSRTTPLGEGVTLDTGRALLIDNGTRIEIDIDWNALSTLRGVHNLENVLAALAAVWGLGADPRRAATALLGFEGLPHRCQEVAQGAGVTFIDDSKATNARAAERSLESFGQSVLWIAGGRGKGAGLEALAAVAADRARAAFLIGESAAEIEAALGGRIPTTRCDSIDEAVAAAADAAGSGDVVLLAPGCASFDQFRSFEERGERFAQAARRWTQARTTSAAGEEGGST